MADEAKSEPAERYSLDELLSRARDLTGYAPNVLAGALYGEERKTMTAGEAKNKAKKWLEREADA